MRRAPLLSLRICVIISYGLDGSGSVWAHRPRGQVSPPPHPSPLTLQFCMAKLSPPHSHSHSHSHLPFPAWHRARIEWVHGTVLRLNWPWHMFLGFSHHPGVQPWHITLGSSNVTTMLDIGASALVYPALARHPGVQPRFRAWRLRFRSLWAIGSSFCRGLPSTTSPSHHCRPASLTSPAGQPLSPLC